MKKRVLVAWSGGKDSAWALHALRGAADVEVAGLFTTVNESRIAVHGVSRALLERQALATGLPLVAVDLPAPCANDEYERAMRHLVARSLREGITHFAFGDLFLEDIRRYREKQFAGSGIALLFPLWGLPTDRLARDMTQAGTKAWIACVDTERAPRAWAGACYDARFIERIAAPIDPCGENGEFHTLVFEGPMLGRPVPCRPGRVRDEGRFVYSELEPA